MYSFPPPFNAGFPGSKVGITVGNALSMAVENAVGITMGAGKVVVGVVVLGIKVGTTVIVLGVTLTCTVGIALGVTADTGNEVLDGTAVGIQDVPRGFDDG